MSNRRSLAALILSAAMLAGCSSQAQGPEEPRPVENQSDPVVETTPSHPAPAEPEYGQILGTLQVDVTNPDGYEATVEISVHEPVLLSVPGQLGPSCVVSLEAKNDGGLSVTDATGILMQAMTYKTALKSHDGFPPPVDFDVPVISMRTPVSNADLGGAGGNGATCDTGITGASFLTAQGVEGEFIDVEWNRATPSSPMPSSLDEIEFYDNEDKDVYSLNIKVGNLDKCTIHPTNDFTFVDREERIYAYSVREGMLEGDIAHIEQYIASLSEEELLDMYEYNYPDRNNGKCSFRFTSST